MLELLETWETNMNYPEIVVASDLHIDLYKNPYEVFTWFDVPENKNRIFVLAGDLFTDTHKSQPDIAIFLQKCLSYFAHVVFVAGNHDFWGHSLVGEGCFDDLMVESLSGHEDRIHYLTPENTCVIDGIEFWGCTFWTKIEHPLAQMQIQTLNDYQQIYSMGDEDLSVIFTNHINQIARNGAKRFLNSTMEETAGKRVIVTHFPLFREKLPEYHNPVDEYYNNHMEMFFYEYPPVDLMIHGHTHNQYDYYFDNMRVVCHPRGYPSQSAGYQLKVVDLNEQT